MEWYYERNGEQCGPVSEVELHALLRAGEFASRNLVWKKGMADWVPYSEAFSSPPSSPAVTRRAVEPPHDAGFGNRLPSSRELRAVARERMAGHWGIAALVVFLRQLLQQVTASLLPVIGVIVSWMIAGPLALGCHAFFLGVVRRESVDVSTLFDGFSQFSRALLIFILVGLIIVFGMCLAALPGGLLMLAAGQGAGPVEENPLFIVALLVACIGVVCVGYYLWLRYAMVYFIALDEPEMKPLDVLAASSVMMSGQKRRLLWLSLTFIGWHLLGFCAFVIGLFWSTAYMTAAYAAFYEDLRMQSQAS